MGNDFVYHVVAGVLSIFAGVLLANFAGLAQMGGPTTASVAIMVLTSLLSIGIIFRGLNRFEAELTQQPHSETLSSREKHPLAITDPESLNPEIDNQLHLVSGLRAAHAYNDLCRMLGGAYPDCRIQEEAPKAHEFFMNFFMLGRS